MTLSKTQRQNGRKRKADKLRAEGVLEDAEQVHLRVQSEAVDCPYCGKQVHPDNLAKHMDVYHADVVKDEAIVYVADTDYTVHRSANMALNAQQRTAQMSSSRQQALLTPDQMQDMALSELEQIIHNGLATFIQVGMALMAIRETQKYKQAGYTDFGVYLQERWGMSRSYAHRQMEAGYIATNLLPIGNKLQNENINILPTHETQLRPLTRLGTSKNPAPEKWIEAWTAACEIADVPTEKDVRYVVDEMLYSAPPPVPEGEFNVIYADPPWQYRNSGLTGGAEDHYPTMATEDICAMQIPATDNAVLFLWSTNSLLPDALRVCEAWGFNYKTKLVWDKERETYGKIGFYGFSQTEDLLIATRGSFVPEYKPVLFLREPKREHSRKPEVMRSIIEKMYPDAQYLELFARNQPDRDNWTFWGNQA